MYFSTKTGSGVCVMRVGYWGIHIIYYASGVFINTLVVILSNYFPRWHHRVIVRSAPVFPRVKLVPR